jgi:hypothetical protein
LGRSSTVQVDGDQMTAGWSMVFEKIMLESNGWSGTTFRRKAIPRWKHVLESNVLESNRAWGLFACSGRVW